MTRRSLMWAVFVVSGCGNVGDLEPSEPAARVTQAYERGCATSDTLTSGIDVSVHQGFIDWDRVADSGVSFAFIRVSDGLEHPDAWFERNWENAARVGILRGAYQYFRASLDPIAQATLVLDSLQAAGGLHAADLPPVLDVENPDGQSPEVVQQRAQEWLRYIEAQTGKRPLVYTRASLSSLVETALSGYPLWVAHYLYTTDECPYLPDGWSAWRFWQWSDQGVVSGIDAPVDRNVFDGGREQLVALAGGTDSTASSALAAGDARRLRFRLPLESEQNVRVMRWGHVDFQTRYQRYDDRLQDVHCGDATYEGHQGTDFAQERGAWIVAAAPGEVIETSDGHYDRCSAPTFDSLPKECRNANYGNEVRIRHADGSIAIYGHMIRGSIVVEKGQQVACGGRLGQMGSSGVSLGTHLHFELRHRDQTVFDPFAGDCPQTGIAPPESRWVAQGDTLPKAECPSPDTSPSSDDIPCWSTTLEAMVPHGDCVQVTYDDCTQSGCGWYQCSQGQWMCLAGSACAGNEHGHPACGAPTDPSDALPSEPTSDPAPDDPADPAPEPAPESPPESPESSCGSPCSECILGERSDILPFYAGYGWDTSCSMRDAIVKDWCGIAPTAGFQLRHGACSSSCEPYNDSDCGSRCTQCVFGVRDDLVQFYVDSGWTISCATLDGIIEDWCSLDSAGCTEAKTSSVCQDVCP